MVSIQFQKCLTCIVQACCAKVCSDYEKWIKKNFYISIHNNTKLSALQKSIEKVESFRYKDL